MGWTLPAVPQHVYEMPSIELAGHLAGVGGEDQGVGSLGEIDEGGAAMIRHMAG